MTLKDFLEKTETDYRIHKERPCVFCADGSQLSIQTTCADDGRSYNNFNIISYMKELDNDIMDTYRCTEEYFSSNKFGNIDKNIMMFLYKNMPLYLNVPYNVVENLLERHGKIERIDHSSRLW